MKSFLIFALLEISMVLCIVNAMEFTVDSLFGSHMVLQQNKEIAFWGTANPGDCVKILFGEQQIEVSANSSCVWRAVFPARSANKKPYSATISCNGKNITISDILIGGVWICAGQSNMEMPIDAKFRHGWSAQNCEKEIASADYPLIRYADQKNRLSHKLPLEKAELSRANWEVCSPGTAAKFSATAFFFARELHKAVDTPIGLVDLTWRGTKIEPWISEDGYKRANLTSEIQLIEKFKISDAEFAAYEKTELERSIHDLLAYRKHYVKAGAKAQEDCADFSSLNYDDSSWENASQPPNTTTLIRYYRTRFKMPGTRTPDGKVTLTANFLG